MKIGNVEIGIGESPFVIAEMSGNHNGSLDRALEIVDAIARSGADALKLQTYTAATMTLDLEDGEFFLNDESSLWKGQSLYSLYEKAHTPWEWHGPLFQRAREKGLIAFSTPFDATAVDFLVELDVPAFKIASFENADLELIRRAASTGKPLIISTGMATLAQIEEAVTAARMAGCRDLALLKCTSSYPADPAASNLAAIPVLRELFGCEVGLSDHTLGIGAAVAAVAIGATLLEKHVTLARAEGGVDAAFSLEPEELAQLVRESRVARRALGRVEFGPSEAERGSMVFRRSLYVCEDMVAGEVFTSKNLRAIRPGFGLAPKFLDLLIGKRVRNDVKRGTPASFSLIG